jgi:hypothetical protein
MLCTLVVMVMVMVMVIVMVIVPLGGEDLLEVLRHHITV